MTKVGDQWVQVSLDSPGMRRARIWLVDEEEKPSRQREPSMSRGRSDWLTHERQSRNLRALLLLAAVAFQPACSKAPGIQPGLAGERSLISTRSGKLVMPTSIQDCGGAPLGSLELSPGKIQFHPLTGAALPVWGIGPRDGVIYDITQSPNCGAVRIYWHKRRSIGPLGSRVGHLGLEYWVTELEVATRTVADQRLPKERFSRATSRTRATRAALP